MGNLTMAQVAKIGWMKMPSSYAKSNKTAAKEVLGTCISLGITIEGKDPRELQKELDQGKWDELFQK
jgi:large subunit ribosomal protein L11